MRRLSVGPDELGPLVAVTSGTAGIGWMAGEFHDAYFFRRVSHHHVDTRGFEELEASAFAEHRWWSASELSQTAESVVPNGLAALLGDFLAGNRTRRAHTPALASLTSADARLPMETRG